MVAQERRADGFMRRWRGKKHLLSPAIKRMCMRASAQLSYQELLG